MYHGYDLVKKVQISASYHLSIHSFNNEHRVNVCCYVPGSVLGNCRSEQNWQNYGFSWYIFKWGDSGDRQKKEFTVLLGEIIVF